jgi:hypothetical protein
MANGGGTGSGSTAGNGSSVHDAADAIETMEQEKRALAEEARRRAAQWGDVPPDDVAERSAEEQVRRRNNWLESSGGTLDPSQWRRVGDVDSRRSTLVFDAGDRVAVAASAIAGPLPTYQFRWTSRAEGLDQNGDIQAAVATREWFSTVEHSSGFTGWGKPNVFILRAGSESPGHRWTITIPPQETAHGNAAHPTLTVYIPASDRFRTR